MQGSTLWSAEYLVCGSPGTGQKLKYGKAMQARASQVELPSVAALFADISSKGPERQRRWSPRTPGTPRVRPSPKL